MFPLVVLWPVLLLCALLAMELVEDRLAAGRRPVRVESPLDPPGSPFQDEAIRR